MTPIASALDAKLLDDWQRDFPLVSRPFEVVADMAGCSEVEAIDRLEFLRTTGRISRIGATCAPNTVSASTLAALSAPEADLEEIAEIISEQPGVNHSYLRENHWNIWFVATGPDRAHVDGVLDNIRRRTGLRVLDLRLVRPFNVDLGFGLGDGANRCAAPRRVRTDCLQPGDRDILQSLTNGMPICPQPYKSVAARLNRSEHEVIDRIAILQDAGIISRLGVIVRHRALGWSSNAMVVWNIEPERIDAAGPALAACPGVTLCYERRPVDRIWPYRLYCMIHAQSRGMALDVLTRAAGLPELAGVPYKILFSSRCFKQTGAMIARRGAAA